MKKNNDAFAAFVGALLAAGLKSLKARAVVDRSFLDAIFGAAPAKSGRRRRRRRKSKRIKRIAKKETQ